MYILPLIISILCFQASAAADNTEELNKINQFTFTIKSLPFSSEIPQGLNHYAEHMDNFIQKNFEGQPTITEAMLNIILNEGESEYFKKLPAHTQAAINMLHPINERFIFCMTRYTD